MLLSISVTGVDGLPSFRQITARTEQWSARQGAALHWVQQTTTFRDGLQKGRATNLTNYFVRPLALTHTLPAVLTLPITADLSPLPFSSDCSCCTAVTAIWGRTMMCGPRPMR